MNGSEWIGECKQNLKYMQPDVLNIFLKEKLFLFNSGQNQINTASQYDF